MLSEISWQIALLNLFLLVEFCYDVFTDVELECLATWKEGSTQYFVARRFFRKSERQMANDEERYRCFIYAKTPNNTWNLAQSGDATCSALDSVTDGARTLKMKQSESNSHNIYTIL